MESEAAKSYISTLLDYQYDLLYLNNSWGENHAEFLFAQVSRVLVAHPEIKGWFLSKVETTLFNFNGVVNDKSRPKDFIPSEYIWFVAHLTRWPEFEELAKELESSNSDAWSSNPLIKSSEVLRQSLKNDWEERDFYEAFVGEQNWV